MVAYADRQRQLEAGFRKRDFIPERRIDFSGYRELIWHKRPLYEEIRRGGFSTPFRELLCDNLIFASPLKKNTDVFLSKYFHLPCLCVEYMFGARLLSPFSSWRQNGMFKHQHATRK